MQHSKRESLLALEPWMKAGRWANVIIETPKGSRNKFAFNPKLNLFELKKVLPVGMSFPYDFGFIPSTLAEDGDPLDVLVVMDEPAFPGCLLRCRIVGIVEGDQGEGKVKERNDRVVAIEENNQSFRFVKTLADLGKPFVRELEKFFVNYHELTGEKYRVLGTHGPGIARKRIREAIRAAKGN